eukprot:403368442
MYPKKKNDGLEQKLLNQNIYHSVLPFMQFVEQYNSLTTLKDKVELLKQQFSYNPYEYDLGNTQVNQASLSTQTHMINTMTFEQVELSLFFLQDIIKAFINPFEEFGRSSSSENGLADFLTYLTQVQCVIVLCVGKLYNQLLISEFFDSAHYDQEKVFVIQNGFDILGDAIYYLIKSHPGRLKPSFKTQLQTKLSDCMKLLIRHEENELFDRLKLSDKFGMSTLMVSNSGINQPHQQEGTRSTIMQRKLSSEEKNEKNHQIIMKKQIFGDRAKFFGSKPLQKTSNSLLNYKILSKQSPSRAENVNKQYLDEENHLLEDDKIALESLFYSLIRITNTLFNDSHLARSFNLQEQLMTNLYLPLITLSTSYQTIFMDSYQELSSRLRLNADILEHEFTYLMYDKNTGVAYKEYSLQTLLLRSFQDSMTYMNNHSQVSQLQRQQTNQFGVGNLNTRMSKNLTISNKNDFTNNQSVMVDQGWTVLNDKIGIILEQIAKQQLWQYLLQVDFQHKDLERQLQQEIQEKEQKKLRENNLHQDISSTRKNHFQGMQIEQRRVATPTLKRKKTLGMLSIKSSNLALASANNSNNSSALQRKQTLQVDTQVKSDQQEEVKNDIKQQFSQFSQSKMRVIKKPLDEIQSPSIFVKRLVGQASAGLPGGFNSDDDDLKTPIEVSSKEPLKIERISNDIAATQLKFKGAQKQTAGGIENLVDADHQEMREKLMKKNQIHLFADPSHLLREGSISREIMLQNSLSKSSLGGSFKNEDQRIDWIRRSHLLLELQIDILKYSFCTYNEWIKMQFLFDRMLDLFKITLFFICSFKHQSELFMKVEDLNDLMYADLYPCNLIYTFKITMSIIQTENKFLQEAFYEEFKDLLIALANGHYDQVDDSYLLRIYYLIFFEQKILRCGSMNKLHELTSNYPENRIKDVENSEFLRNIKAYKTLKTKMLQSELNSHKREAQNTTSNRQDNKLQQSSQQITVKITNDVNKILFQQQVLTTLLELTHMKHTFHDLCWKEIDETLMHEYSVDINQSKLYQYLKFAILLMRKQDNQTNQEIFRILVNQEQQDKYFQIDYKPWKLNPYCQGGVEERFSKKFWENIIQKIKKFLIHHNDAIYRRAMDRYNNLNNLNQIGNSNGQNNELMPLVVRNLSEIHPESTSGGTGAGGSNQSTIISEPIYNFYKRFLLFGLQNIDIANKLYQLIYDTQKQIQLKDIQSYELKLHLFKCLFIARDYSIENQSDLLEHYSVILKKMFDFISDQINHHLKKDNPVSSQQLPQGLPPGFQNLAANQPASRKYQNLIDTSGVSQQQTQDVRRLEREKAQLQLRGLISLAVDLLQNYIDFKKYQQENSTNESITLNLMQRSAFQETILPELKRLTMLSQTQAIFFIESLIQIYFFDKVEIQYISSIDQYKNFDENQLKYAKRNYLPKVLEFLVQSVVDAMTQKEKFEKQTRQLIANAFIQTFHSHIVEFSTASGIQTLRFSKYISVPMIKNIKKLMIELREEFNDRPDLIIKLKQIIERAFQIQPNPLVFREFFGFLREIFYYNKDMDDIDNNLAQDTLEILNNLLKNKDENDSSYKHMNLMNSNPLNNNNTISQQQYYLYQQNNSQQQMQRSLLQNSRIVDKSPVSQNFQPVDYFYFSDQTPGLVSGECFFFPSDGITISFMFKIDLCQLKKHPDPDMTLIHLKSKSANLNEPMPIIHISVYDNKMRICSESFDLDDNWHLLVMRFEKYQKINSNSTHKLNVYLDNLTKPISEQQTKQSKFTLPKNHQFLISYGCKIEELSETDGKPKLTHPFYGRMSLPFAFSAKFDFADKCFDVQMRQIFVHFIQHQIEKKLLLQVSIGDVLSYFKKKQSNPKAFKDFPKDFESNNDFNELFINLHRIATELNHSSTLHQIRPSMTFVGLGGFKLMYPLFEKSLYSNMSSAQKSDIWKHLFRVLRTMMNVEPAHICRLHRNKNLIDILKYCLIRGGLKNIITKELLNDVIKILGDVKTNRFNLELEEFYRRYLQDILLCDKLCSMEFIDKQQNNELAQSAIQHKQYYKVYEEIAINLSKMYLEQLSSKQLTQFSILQLVETKECNKKLIALLKKFSDYEYLKSNNKLSRIISKQILNTNNKDALMKLLSSIQKGKVDSTLQLNKPLLKVYLKIVEGIITDPVFKTSNILRDGFKQAFDVKPHMKNLFQFKTQEEYYQQYDNDKLMDQIVALTFKVLYSQFFTFFESQKSSSRMPDRHMVNSSNIKDNQEQFYLAKNALLDEIFQSIQSNNNNSVRAMQKTLCTMLLSSYERAYSKTRKFKYGPQSLIEFAKKQKMLELMDHPDFDKYLFQKVRDLFKLFDFDTQSLYLDFLKQSLDLSEINGTNIFSMSDKIKQLKAEQKLEDTKRMKFIMYQEQAIKQILSLTLTTNDKSLINFSERIVSSVCKAFLEQCNMVLTFSENKGVYLIEGDEKDIYFSKEDTRYLLLMRQLLWMFDRHWQSQIIILNDVFMRAQEIMIWMSNQPNMQDLNQVNFNLKIIILVQIVEDIIFRKSLEEKEQMLRGASFIQAIAKLMVVLDERKLLYFDYPFSSILESDEQIAQDKIKENEQKKKEEFTAGARKVDQDEKTRLTSKERLGLTIQFVEGGPLRIVLSILLQIIRTTNQESQETYQQAMELLRHMLFREPSQFLNQFKIQAPNEQNLNQKPSIPLLRLYQNLKGNSKNKIQFVSIKKQTQDAIRQFLPYQVTKKGQEKPHRTSMNKAFIFLSEMLTYELYDIVRKRAIKEQQRLFKIQEQEKKEAQKLQSSQRQQEKQIQPKKQYYEDQDFFGTNVPSPINTHSNAADTMKSEQNILQQMLIPKQQSQGASSMSLFEIDLQYDLLKLIYEMITFSVNHMNENQTLKEITEQIQGITHPEVKVNLTYHVSLYEEDRQERFEKCFIMGKLYTPDTMEKWADLGAQLVMDMKNSHFKAQTTQSRGESDEIEKAQNAYLFQKQQSSSNLSDFGSRVEEELLEADQNFQKANLEKSEDFNFELDKSAQLMRASQSPTSIKLISEERARKSQVFQDAFFEMLGRVYHCLKQQFDQSLSPNTRSHEQFLKDFKVQFIDNTNSFELMRVLGKSTSNKLRESIKQVCTSYFLDLNNFQHLIKYQDEKIDYHYQKNKVPVDTSLISYSPNNLTKTPKLQPQKSFNPPHAQALLGQSQTIPKGSLDNLKAEMGYAESFNGSNKNLSNNLVSQQALNKQQQQQTQQFVSQMRKRSGSPESQNTFEIMSEDGGMVTQSIRAYEKSPQGLQRREQELVKNEPKQSFEHRTLHYYYTKYQYRKIVKRLQEDQSSMWYDNLEQIRKDYADMKEIYELITNEKVHADSQIGAQSARSQRNQEEQKTQNTKQDQQQKSQKNIPKRQYDHFIRQRRNFDTWGRMMLLKPDRKYKETKFWLTHMYFVHDFLKSVLAISFFEDSDFPDVQNQQLPQQYQNLYANLVEQEIKQEFDAYQSRYVNSQDGESVNFNQYLSDSVESAMKQPRSKQFQMLREMLLRRLEQNEFLYNLLMNPQLVIPRSYENQKDNQTPFEFHPIESMGTKNEMIQFEVQYNAIEGPYFGILYVSNEYIIFKSMFEVTNEDKYPFAELLDHQLVKKEKIWHFQELEEIFKRRFLLVEQACEIFTKEKKSYLFNFFNPEQCSRFFNFLDRHKKLYGHLEIIEDSIKEFRELKIKENWLKGEITNQQFLLMINKYSGRSFNDLNQYPIFPWIIRDYHTESYDEFKKLVDKGEALRDLTKHIGVISEVKLQNAIKTYNKDNDGYNLYGDQKHHMKFGYSNKMFTLAYLIRLEPFTDSFIQVNKNLDNPDRLVQSIEHSFHSIESDAQNNSELTPEYFYLPEVFRNHNLNHFGSNREGKSVNEVLLPKWCQNEHDFIRINREILDSKQVSLMLTFWVDLMFGAKQRKEEYYNVFFQYAYEEYIKIKANRDEMDRAKIDTIREFMQVPKKVFKENLYTEKNLKEIGASMPGINNIQGIVVGRDPQSQQVNQQFYNEDIESIQNTPQQQQQRNQDVTMSTSALSGRRDNRVMVTGTSLIRQFMEGPVKKEQDLTKICEVHRITDNDKQVMHMQFHMNTLLVFVADKSPNNDRNPFVKAVGCKTESFTQDDLKYQVNLGLRLRHLKGDLSTTFQTIYLDKNRGRFPLLYTCQNLDNTIKVFDLNVKKGQPNLLFQETQNNAVVTVIKFSPDAKYFVTGDADGIIHHYIKNTDDAKDYYSSSLASSAPLQKQSEVNPAFPYTLKYKIQDHMASVLALDINATLDMYVTASADGNLFIRCLRTSQLWKVIPINLLTSQNIKIKCLKMSLHGYIVLMVREGKQYLHIFVFSINGDLLHKVRKNHPDQRVKYVQLTEREDQVIMVMNIKNVYKTKQPGAKEQINHKNSQQEVVQWNGVIGVYRLYDFSPVEQFIERNFYGFLSRQQNQNSKGSARSQNTQQQNQQQQFFNSPNSMPRIKSFALSKDEGKMNIFLVNQDIICIDESKEQILQHLDDFGFT